MGTAQATYQQLSSGQYAMLGDFSPEHGPILAWTMLDSGMVVTSYADGWLVVEPFGN